MKWAPAAAPLRLKFWEERKKLKTHSLFPRLASPGKYAAQRGQEPSERRRHVTPHAFLVGPDMASGRGEYLKGFGNEFESEALPGESVLFVCRCRCRCRCLSIFVHVGAVAS